MLDYLVTSRARRRLLRLLWSENARGSVSDLARLAGLSFRSAHKELNGMREAGLASCSRVGNATVFQAVKDHLQAGLLRGLLREGGAARRMGEPSRRQVELVRSWLSAWGAPLLAAAAPGRPPSLESVLVQGAKLAPSDASVARGLPVCLWKNRNRLDAGRLRSEAQREGEKQAMGFFLELAGTLGGDPELCRMAERFRDRRVRKDVGFFRDARSAFARKVAEGRTPAVARKWNFWMNMGMETFASTFKKFVGDAEVSG